MRTATKIAIARGLYRAIHLTRGAVGLTDETIVKRSGVTYALDLNDGIDFAVFLNRYERSTTRALERLVKPGFHVLDIGANVGIHTLRLAHLVGPSGHVTAFEPTARAFGKLQRNIRCNPSLVDRIEAIQGFLSSSDSATAPDAVPSNWPLVAKSSKNSRLHAEHLGEYLPTTNVRAMSLDTAIDFRVSNVSQSGNVDKLTGVDLIKIDVDGYECDVLSGASKTISTYRPIMVMELAPYVLTEHGGSLKLMLEPFFENGYKLYHESNLQPLNKSITEIEDSIAVGACINVVAMV